MANQNPTWDDFFQEGLGPQLPLTSGQRVPPIFGVLPSGEGGGFDYGQDRSQRIESPNNVGYGINVPFPYPNEETSEQFKLDGAYTTEWWAVSGIVKTYGEQSGQLYDEETQKSIFSFDGLASNFSNSQDIVEAQIEDFTIFNDYIHHERLPSSQTNGSIISIPYISTYNVAIDYRPYY